MAREWDELAQTRHTAIKDGLDISYVHVLVPSMVSALPESRGGWWLDAGCGTGHLVRHLWNRCSGRLIGIDPSAKSIAIARREFPNLDFSVGTLESFARAEDGRRFETIVANMVLQNTDNLKHFVRSAARLLEPGGTFLASVPHPCFWPSHGGYDSMPWYDYWRETWIQAPFRTSLLGNTAFHTTHVHRPLEMYFGAFVSEGLAITDLLEPAPPPTIAQMYDPPWKTPRFLLFRLRRPA